MINTLHEGMDWPPMDLSRFKMKEHGTWYSGEGELLASLYFNNELQHYMNLTYGLTDRNRFWARQIKNKSNFFVHVPIANDIAETSSSFLFGESPIIRFASQDKGIQAQQKELDDMLTTSGFFSKLVEGAEIASAIGGVYIKIAWDKELSSEPIPTIVQCEQAFPKFKFGMLSEVTFVYELSSDGSTVYRLAERITKGKIYNTLYSGSSSSLGKIIQLDENITGDLTDEVETPDILTCVYIPNLLPNKLERTSPLGRSDYQGQETLMDALDETFSAWMVDIQIARGKIHVPSGYVKDLGDGNKAFNLDTVMYEELDMDPTAVTTPIVPNQFAIRSQEFETTCLNLLDRIITSAGYSPQSFGLNIQGRAESGVALNVRERKSFSTTNKKQSYWEPAIKKLVIIMCLVKNEFLEGGFTNKLDINVAFADGISNNMTETATCIKMLSDAAAISTDTKVRMAHPEWTDEQVDNEVMLINSDGGSVDDPEDLFQIGNKNKQANGDGVIGIKGKNKDPLEE